MSLKFTSEDFVLAYKNFHGEDCEHLAGRANAKFKMWLEKQPKVFAFVGTKNSDGSGFAALAPSWHPLEGKPGDTHCARLVCIEEIEKKPCEHRPIHKKQNQEWLSAGKIAPEYFQWECEYCGVKLKAKWEAV